MKRVLSSRDKARLFLWRKCRSAMNVSEQDIDNDKDENGADAATA
jgi:hypothetical protein